MAELAGSVTLTGIVLIDIAIGLIFAILVFSLVATALNEAIAGMLNYRGEHLRKGILRLIADGEFGKSLLAHPSITALKGPKNRVQWILHHLFIWGDGARDTERMPSAIPPETFARALVEKLAALRTGESGLSDAASKAIEGLAISEDLKGRLREIVARIDPDAIQEALAAKLDGTLDQAKADALDRLTRARQEIEHDLALWFDDVMDRVTGWYVRRAKTMLFVLGFAMAAFLGFDIVGYGKRLATDDALRSAMLARAEAAVQTETVGSFRVTPSASLAGLSDSPLAPAARFDTDNDGVISAAEASRAEEDLDAAFALLSERTQAAILTTRSELSVALDRSFWQADLATRGQLILSWLVIGLGCTLGGQFWFDLLRSLLKVRAGAAGLNQDRHPPRPSPT